MDIFLALNAAYLVLVGAVFSLAKPENDAGTAVMLFFLACCTALAFFSIYYI
ncbi:hypothetical protein [Salinibacter ruber]|uniref:hypothetical protein n=1 Tax=Salinibacter ruber TaxID=146919 RepID=UPI0021698089|nr:hypothetical protein [Salinibacter ruber]MCS3610987.1 hypothetical protein [Salinibacter ruber]